MNYVAKTSMNSSLLFVLLFTAGKCAAGAADGGMQHTTAAEHEHVLQGTLGHDNGVNPARELYEAAP